MKSAYYFTICLLALVICPMLSAQDETKSEAAPSAEAATAEQPISIDIRLRTGEKMAGNPVDVDKVSLNTTFGQANIPVSTIAGIYLDGSATVVLKNGDSLTGELMVNELKFLSPWGTGTVNINAVESLTFVNGVSWTNSAAGYGGGKRWSLVAAQPTVQSSVQQRTSQPAPQINRGF